MLEQILVFGSLRYKKERTGVMVLSFFLISPYPCESDEPGGGTIELYQQLLVDCLQPGFSVETKKLFLCQPIPNIFLLFF